VHPYCNA